MAKKIFVYTNYKICSIVLAFLFSFPLYEASSQISLDAAQITVRQQEEGAWIDTAYAVIMDSGLAASRRIADTLEYIHAFQHINMYSISLNTNMEWANAWRDGNLISGQPEIDSLSKLYNLVEVRSTPGWNYFDLIFKQALNTPVIAQQYAEISGVISAEFNTYGGEGDDIVHFSKMKRDYFILSTGWGDCWAGCIYHYYWYIIVDNDNNNYSAELKEEKFFDPGNQEPYFYRWNYPPRYPITMFSNNLEIYDSVLTSKDWWIRKHSIEGIWRFFIYDYPWAGEDFDKKLRWDSLKSQLTNNVDSIINLLEYSLTDEDEDVRNSAQFALDTILSITSVDKEISPTIPKNHTLFQNYPNPFNPTTKLRYAIANRHFVSLKIYDVLGKEIVTLVNEEKPKGSYEVEFDARGLTSGIYFYRLQAGEYIETKMMILLH